MKAYRLLLLLPLLSMSKCDKDVFEKEVVPIFALPVATQSGANTIGFIIDGRVWRDYGITCTTFKCDSNKVRGIYTNASRQFTLYAGLSAKNVSESFAVNLSQITRAGTYTSNAVADGISFTNHPYDEYLSRPGAASIVVTKMDTVQHIIAGTFSSVLRSRTDTTKKVAISDGRFDIRYR